MAEKFPIQHTGALDLSGQQAPMAAIDPRTGDETIARGIMALGQFFIKMADDTHRQESALELSELKRQIDEKGYAAYNAVTGNEEADDKLWSKFREEIGALRSERENVNASLKQYIDAVIPNWHQNYTHKSISVRRKNASDKFKTQEQDLLATGKLDEYQKQLNTRLALNDISQAEFEDLRDNAIPNSLLEQSRRMIASNEGVKINQAQAILKKLPDAAELNTEQLEYRNKLLRSAQNTSRQMSDAAIKSVILEKDKLKDALPEDKAKSVPALKSHLVQGGVTGDQLDKWFTNLDKWAEGGKSKFEEYDPHKYSALLAQVNLEPRAVTDQQIFSFVGYGKDGGITAQQASSLVDLRKRNIDEVPSMNKEIHNRQQKMLKGLYDSGMFSDPLRSAEEEMLAYSEAANKLTVYHNTFKDLPVKDYEEFFANLITDNQKTSWWKMMLTPPVVSIAKTLMNFRKMRHLSNLKDQSTAPPTTYMEGDVETIEGVKWRLETKGETPDKDIWVEVE